MTLKKDERGLRLNAKLKAGKGHMSDKSIKPMLQCIRVFSTAIGFNYKYRGNKTYKIAAIII
jgi:hypothetical protein